VYTILKFNSRWGNRLILRLSRFPTRNEISSILIEQETGEMPEQAEVWIEGKCVLS